MVKKKCLAETFDQHPKLLGWSKDDKSVLVEEPHGVRMQLYRLPLSGGRPTPLIPVDSTLNPHTFINQVGDYVGMTSQTFNKPPEAFISTLKPFQSHQISHVQTKINKRFGKARVISWPTYDAKSIEGILVTPANYDGKHPLPLVLAYHGGPTSQWFERFLGSPYGPFSFGILSNAGYAVLAVNVRGSKGYGPEFAMANYRDLGGGDLQDALTGVDYLVKQKIADPKRLSVYGYSYGGYMAAWTITQTPRFKAAIVGAGLTDLVSFDGTSVFAHTLLPSYLKHNFCQEPSVYNERSPITHIAHVNTPTLIQYGENDHIAPMSQGSELFHALNSRKIPVTMYVFPGENHAFGNNPKMLMIGMQQVLDWLNEYSNHSTCTSRIASYTAIGSLNKPLKYDSD